MIRRVSLASIVFAAAAYPALGEIHDYMILRIVYLKTSCGTLSMERLQVPAPHARFKVTCKDATAYPDGLTIYCADPDDDRHCRIETPAKQFDSLDLLKR